MAEIELSAESRGVAPGRGRLTGRRILVVGGGQAAHGDDDIPGNGRAISILAGREGAAVAVADLSLDSAEDTALLVRKEGVEAVAIQADATDEDDVRRMLAEAATALGGLDGIVLNVGIDGGVRLAGTDVATWDRVFAVNARTHFLGKAKRAVQLLHTAAPAQAGDGVQQDGATLGTIASVAGELALAVLPLEAGDAELQVGDAIAQRVPLLDGLAR